MIALPPIVLPPIAVRLSTGTSGTAGASGMAGASGDDGAAGAGGASGASGAGGAGTSGDASMPPRPDVISDVVLPPIDGQEDLIRELVGRLRVEEFDAKCKELEAMSQPNRTFPA